MPDNNDRCSKLRKLHDRIEEELRILKGEEREENRVGFDNPVVISDIIKSLQSTLSSIDVELQKCPPDEGLVLEHVSHPNHTNLTDRSSHTSYSISDFDYD